MAYLHQFELEIIQRIQSFGSLKTIMGLISDWGIECAAMIALWAFFCIKKATGRRAIVLYFFASGLTYILKIAFQQPRPFWITNSIRELGTSGGFGMPSGHVLTIATVAFCVAEESHAKIVARTIAIVSVLLVSISRVFLGVHFISDVAVGILFAVLIAIALRKLRSKWLENTNFFRVGVDGLEFATLFILVAFAFLLVAFPSEGAHARKWQQFVDYRFHWGNLLPSLLGITATLVGAELSKRMAFFANDVSLAYGSFQFIYCLAGIFFIKYTVSALNGDVLSYNTDLLSSVLCVLWATVVVPYFHAPMQECSLRKCESIPSRPRQR